MASHAKRFIHPSHVQNVIQAVGFAEHLRCPLNAHYTVTWCSFDDAVARKCQTALLERYQKWARYWGFRAAYTWSLERSPKLGVHSHILLHVPRSQRHELRHRMFRRWVTEACGFWKNTMVRGRTVPRKLEPVRGEQRLTTIADLQRRTLYQVKDIQPESELAGLLPFERLRKRTDRGGLIAGKRVGTSRNLGAFARAAMSANDNEGPR